MSFRSSFALLTWLALAAPYAAQSPARAELYTRVEGRRVLAAIEIELDEGWHLYHRELGHPEAIGKPTTVALSGTGITWGDVRFPEPRELPQGLEDEHGKEIWIWAHEGTLELFAAGELVAGADGKDVQARVDGLVCESTCIPWRATLDSAGRGADALFAAFPADLEPGAGATTAATAAATDAGATPASTAATAPATSAHPSVADDGADAPPQDEPASSREDAATSDEAVGLPGLGGLDRLAGLLAEEDEAPREDVRLRGHADTTLYTRVDGTRITAALVIEIAPGWHLYHDELGNPAALGQPTRIELQADGVRWGPLHFPAPERLPQGLEDANGDEIWIHSHDGTILVWADGELEPGGSGEGVRGTIHGQTCAELCVPYDETFVDRGRGDDALFAEIDARRDAPEPSAPGGETGKPSEGLGAFLFLAVFWGFFTLLMPCTYPMIPITISFFTKQAQARGGRVLPLSLAYGAGIVLVFILIGVVVGQAIIPFAAHPVTNLVIGALFLYFALVLFGVVNMQPPRFLLNAAGKASMRGGYLGVFLMGTTLVVTSFTCTAPFVGSLLSAGAQDGNLGRIVLGMGVFGLTMAVPFVLLSLLPGRIQSIPRSGEWMNTLKHFLGFVEVAAALKFLSNADIVWEWHLISRELFLAGWAAIFIVAGLYLFGLFSKGARPGTKRLTSGVLSVGFGAYCLWAMFGHALDPVMTAFAPPYSGGRFFPAWYDVHGEWTIVLDDYDAAADVARRDDKLLLVNFTGLTCVNCRLMELNVFPTPAIAGLLETRYVESRLHTDGKTNLERIRQLQGELAGSVATPYYVLVDPATGEAKAKFEGATRDADAFLDFLKGPFQ